MSIVNYRRIAIVAALALAGCSDTPRPERTGDPEKTKETMKDQSNDKHKAVVRRLYEDGLNERNYRLLDELIAENYSGIRGESGPEGFERTVRSVIAAFPDIRWTIEELVAEGDKVAVRWSWRGTHEGTFRGMFPASHRQVEDRAIAIYQFEDGKVVRSWIASDRLGFLQQIGILPQDLGELARLKAEGR